MKKIKEKDLELNPKVVTALNDGPAQDRDVPTAAEGCNSIAGCVSIANQACETDEPRCNTHEPQCDTQTECQHTKETCLGCYDSVTCNVTVSQGEICCEDPSETCGPLQDSMDICPQTNNDECNSLDCIAETKLGEC